MRLTFTSLALTAAVAVALAGRRPIRFMNRTKKNTHRKYGRNLRPKSLPMTG